MTKSVLEAALDKQLSWEARGIFAYAVTHKLKISVQSIQQWSSPNQFGRDRAKRIFNELFNAGYLALQGTDEAVYLKGRIPESLREQVFARDDYRCVECESVKRLCVDHIIPESKGGATTLENLQTLCRPCNTEKGARYIFDGGFS